MREKERSFQNQIAYMDNQIALTGLKIDEARVKIGEKEQLFEAITAQKISEKLKEQGFEVKKTQIVLKDPIKELGEFPVKIQLGHNLEAEIKLIIIEEKKE